MYQDRAGRARGIAADPSRFAPIQSMTRIHRAEHGCGAYTFADGAGLVELVNAYHPSRCLELGTALGYTACCLAVDGAQVDTVEGDPDHVRLARANIAAAGLGALITVYEGDFATVTKGFVPGYDMAFFDGFAPTVPLVSPLHALLREGGVLVCSNLGFADGAVRAWLNDSARWTPEATIEGGGTRAFLKRSAREPGVQALR